jgi:predicted PurR-regulated permease PerM
MEKAGGMDQTAPRTWRERVREDSVFVRRTLIVFILIAVAAFLWRLSGTVLLVFAAILIAVILRALATTLERYVRIPHAISFYLALLLVIGGTVGTGFFFGAALRGQIGEVIEQLPDLIEAAAAQIGIADPFGEIEAQLDDGTGTNIIGRAAGFGFSVAGVFVDVFIVIIAAIYLAYNPRLYRRGLLSLFPPSNRRRIDKALLMAGHALKMWFVGQLITMTAVGVMSGLAFWWLELPMPVALGLIAGLTNFIPFVGPIIGSIPAVVFALNISFETMLWTIAAVTIVQQIESNLLVPIIQRRAVALPPALALFAIIAFGVIFGFLGVLLAVPLAVAAMVLIQQLWVKGVVESNGMA